MLAETIHAYTDASFDKSHEIAIIGYTLVRSTLDQDSILVSDIDLNIFQIQERNNIRAEIRGAIAALQACPKTSRVLLYCDCQTVCGLPERREKLELNRFLSQSKNRPLANADLYHEFYSTFDKIRPELHWIKGHSSNKPFSKPQEIFSHLDKEVRRRLRKALSEIQ